jgi:hypothetical protein
LLYCCIIILSCVLLQNAHKLSTMFIMMMRIYFLHQVC